MKERWQQDRLGIQDRFQMTMTPTDNDTIDKDASNEFSSGLSPLSRRDPKTTKKWQQENNVER